MRKDKREDGLKYRKDKRSNLKQCLLRITNTASPILFRTNYYNTFLEPLTQKKTLR